MEKQIKEEIIKAADSVLKKFRSLKRGLATDGPLIKPLEKLIDLTSLQNENLVIKKPKKEVKAEMNDKETFVTPEHAQRAPAQEEPEVYTHEGEEEVDDWLRWEHYLDQFGPLTREYLNNYMRDKKGLYDPKFGIHENVDEDSWELGKEKVEFDKQDFIHVGDKMYKGTRGLYELLFKKFPDPKIYKSDDLETYKELLKKSNAHLQGYNDNARIASSASHK